MAKAKGGEIVVYVQWYLLVMIFVAGFAIGLLVNNIVIDIRRKG